MVDITDPTVLYRVRDSVYAADLLIARPRWRSGDRFADALC
jgi:hypothetical protein